MPFNWTRNCPPGIIIARRRGMPSSRPRPCRRIGFECGPSLNALGSGSIGPPYDGGDDEDSGEEDISALVVAGVDASEVLEVAEEAFDAVALLVSDRIVGVRVLARGIWRDDGLAAAFAEPIAQGRCVIGAIGKQASGRSGDGQEVARAGQVMSMAGVRTRASGLPRSSVSA